MNKYEHMSESWGLSRNPFPAEAIHKGNEPYSREVFKEEQKQFLERLVYGAVMDQRGFGYLWSKGLGGESQDTGFGKTALLKNAAREINQDRGETVFRNAGMKPERITRHRSIAAYASLTTTDVTGVYPILFAAVEYLADQRNSPSGTAMMDEFRDAIRKEHQIEEDDTEGLINVLQASRRELGPTLPPLRQDALQAFARSETDFAAFLGEVTPASRTRNGLAYFDFAFTVAWTAGIRHFFVFVDQLEDLATNRTVTQARRSREVGRLRDIIAEMQPFVERVHFVFTFHIRAAQALESFWNLNRLPSFDAEDPANKGSVVVLRGIQNDAQVKDLLKTYLDNVREGGRKGGSLTPFNEATLPILRERSGGRAGILLTQAYRLLDQAAAEELPQIDAAFARRLLGSGNSNGHLKREGAYEPRDAKALDELLK